MKLLIQEPALQILPSLALEVGLNEAIVLQQIHFKLRISENWREEHRWICKTYAEWQKEVFPFWSTRTVRRIITKLEEMGYLLSTDVYNRMHVDKTKWYRINYEQLSVLTGQSGQASIPKWTEKGGQTGSSSPSNLDQPLPKEVNKFKEEYRVVVCYLNEKANKQFKMSSKGTERLVNGRLREGYTVDDFKKVIDLKVADWLGQSRWEKYLRPSTLFSPTNFENYLEESRDQPVPVIQPIVPVTLDFTKGEV